MRVELSEEADAQVIQIDAWWRDNRLTAPDLFADELDRALEDIGATPTIGTLYRDGSPIVRRLLLRRSHYHVYFVQDSNRIYVLAVWSCFRGEGPRL